MTNKETWRPSKKPWDPANPWDFDMMHPADNVPKELLAQAWGLSAEDMALDPTWVEIGEQNVERQRRAKLHG